MSRAAKDKLEIIKIEFEFGDFRYLRANRGKIDKEIRYKGAINRLLISANCSLP